MRDEIFLYQSAALTEILGINVRDRRTLLRIQADTVADQLCMSRDTYRACEAGAIRFTSDQLVGLCELLDTMPSVLFRDTL